MEKYYKKRRNHIWGKCCTTTHIRGSWSLGFPVTLGGCVQYHNKYYSDLKIRFICRKTGWTCKASEIFSSNKPKLSFIRWKFRKLCPVKWKTNSACYLILWKLVQETRKRENPNIKFKKAQKHLSFDSHIGYEEFLNYLTLLMEN